YAPDRPCDLPRRLGDTSDPMKWRAAIVSLGLVAGLGLGWWLMRPAPPGLIVLISIDTLRADRLPVYGYTAGRTPALDTFGTDAIIFDRAYAHAPQTLPSHASMFTGLLPFEHAV